MPRRKDLQSVLIIGSGPIVIGQACEFDYSGTQACKALREEGLRVVLINSNPATIMTDPELADATYVEPLTVEVLDKVLAREKVSAVLPTLGGQTGLNLAMAASKAGVLAKHNVELLGANVKSIEMAEDRELFKQAMARIGLSCPKSKLVTSVEEARSIIEDIGRASKKRARSSRTSASPRSCGRRSRSAVRVAASPTTRASSTAWCSSAWTCRRCTRS
jgi:carbamoyl-phosphate synthase large subunit